MEKFNLSVIRPIKGKKGELVCEYTAYAKTVSDAVKNTRLLFGLDHIVLQTSSIATQEPAGEPSDFAKDIIAKMKERAQRPSVSVSEHVPYGSESLDGSSTPYGWDVIEGGAVAG